MFLGILPETPSAGTRLARGLGTGIGESLGSLPSQLAKKMDQRKENEALKKLTGQDFSGMTPELKKEFMKVFTGGRAQKEQEKYKMMETGLGTIQQMRNLLESTGPLKSIAGLFPGETSRERAEFTQLGKSLIPLVSAGVSIRNQKEFDEYKKIITNPNARQSEIEGALSGLENLLERQLENKSSSLISEKEEQSINKKPIFNVSNPSHKKVRDALMKKFNNDREKVSRELSRNFREE